MNGYKILLVWLHLVAGLIEEIAQVITRGVIMENKIVDLNVLFRNLSNIFHVLFTIYTCLLSNQVKTSPFPV